MKRIFFACAVLLLVLCIVFAACNIPDSSETTETGNGMSTPAISETTKVNKPETTVTVSPPLVTEDPTSHTAAYESTTSSELVPAAEFTSKGYKITKVDGLTYIDGVLIANKTYSLPADYNPGALTSECSQAFNEMKAAAAKEGLNIYIASGFRSYSLQTSLYNRYVSYDGKANADTYSARPGHSEHQTGLAIDLNTITFSFADTPEGRWVDEHCADYGFILRYQKDKEEQTGYCYEPWHIRYVGERVAAAITQSGLCLEEYYGITSTYDD